MTHTNTNTMSNTNTMNMAGIEELKKAFASVEVSERVYRINKYVFFVWDKLGDHYESVFAENKAEAISDLKERINEKAYMYEGRVRFRLERVELGEEDRVVC